jgi:carotenoid cleavage dioxygenase-like enzyme
VYTDLGLGQPPKIVLRVAEAWKISGKRGVSELKQLKEMEHRQRTRWVLTEGKWEQERVGKYVRGGCGVPKNSFALAVALGRQRNRARVDRIPGRVTGVLYRGGELRAVQDGGGHVKVGLLAQLIT